LEQQQEIEDHVKDLIEKILELSRNAGGDEVALAKCKAEADSLILGFASLLENNGNFQGQLGSL